MKRKSYFLRLCTVLMGLILFLSAQAHAQLFEATSDGDWSSGSTWKNGTSPGSELNVGEVVTITANTTVTLDQDITFTGSDAVLNVNGTLQGDQNITIPTGDGIGGNNNSGVLDVNKVSVQSSNVLNLAGELKANVLEIDAPVNLVQSATITVEDTLYLKSGELEIMGTSSININNNSNIVVKNGILQGATFNNHNLIYQGSSRKVSTNLLGADAKPNNLILNLNQNTDSLTLNNSSNILKKVIVNGKLRLKNGRLDLNNHTLEIINFINSSKTGSISGDSKADIIIRPNNKNSSVLRFTDKKDTLRSLIVGGGSGFDHVNLKSSLHLTLQAAVLSKGRLKLNNNNLSLLDTAKFSNYDTSSYITTNGTGHVSMMSHAGDTTVFPVGTDSGYAPAYIMNQGNNATRYNVRVQKGVPANGNSGDDLAKYTSIVDRIWHINTENNVNANLDLKLAWTPQAEVNNFNRSNSFISHYKGGSWDEMAAAQAKATGNGTFAIERKGIQNLSPFAVHDQNTETGNKEMVKQQGEVKVHPNPVEDELTIQSLDFTRYLNAKVYTTTGQLVNTHEFKKNPTTSINVANLPKGIYILQITSEKEMISTKFIKR